MKLAVPKLLISTLLLLVEPMLTAYIVSRICQKTRDNTNIVHSSKTNSIEIGEQEMEEATGIQRAWVIHCSRCKKMKVLSLLEGNDFGRRDEVTNVARMARWVEPLYSGIWLCPDCIRVVVADIESDVNVPTGEQDNG